MNKRRFGVDWDATVKKIDEQNDTKAKYKDERVYYPERNKDGTGGALIRFIPSPDTDVPYVNVYSHSCEGPGGYYIQNCPTTLNDPCPACNHNRKIWNENEEETARKLTKNTKRKLSYYSNILVVNDPKNPENNGKVFLFRYGVKIYDKIMEVWRPKNEISKSIPVFDYYDGANFELIINAKKVGKITMPNYDASKFETPTAVGTDDEIEKIHGTRYSLAEYVTPEKFKPFAELEERFQKSQGVVGVTHAPAKSTPSPVDEVKEAVAVAVAETTTDEGKTEEMFDGDDDAFFNSLQND